MNRYLFLDIDGVLNSTSWAMNTQQTGIWGIDKNTIPHLQRIVDETDCEIVISSTWRILRSLQEIRSTLVLAGLLGARVISRTPVLGGVRGKEVEKWIADNARGDFLHAILDDDTDFFPRQPLVRTNVRYGLTEREAQRCIEILTERL